MLFRKDETGKLFRYIKYNPSDMPCASCDKAYIDDSWNEWCCNEWKCYYDLERERMWKDKRKVNEFIKSYVYHLKLILKALLFIIIVGFISCSGPILIFILPINKCIQIILTFIWMILTTNGVVAYLTTDY